MKGRTFFLLLALTVVIAFVVPATAQFSQTNFAALDGGCASPGYQFVNASNMGMMRDAQNTAVGLCAGGVQVARFNATTGMLPVRLAVTGSAATATANAQSFIITTESIATAAGSTYTETLTNSFVTAASNCLVNATLGSATTGVPIITFITPTAGQLVIKVLNLAATTPAGAAFNGTLIIEGLCV